MTKVLQQGKGSSVDLVMALEDTFATSPTSGGKKLAFNSSSVASSRDLNSPETIQAGRNPLEPFQGNGEVSGDIVLPLDLNQIGFILKAAFGAPTTLPASDIFLVGDYSGYYIHTFTIPDTQPSFTLEQLHKDLAESFVYSGCKVSKLSFNANTDGNENTFTMGIMGSKPANDSGPVAISSMTKSGTTVTCTTSSEHGLSSNNEIVIAGVQGLSGRITVVSAPSTTTFTFTCSGSFTPPTITTGNEPVFHKVKIINPANYTLKRLGTFSALLKKDSNEYRCAKSFGLEIDMGLDGEQRVIGDNGYRSEIPEGNVSITSTITALFKSGEMFREGKNNSTVSLDLMFKDSDNKSFLDFKMNNCKIQETSPSVDTPRGLSQELTAQAFSTSGSSSAITITLLNQTASY